MNPELTRSEWRMIISELRMRLEYGYPEDATKLREIYWKLNKEYQRTSAGVRKENAKA